MRALFSDARSRLICNLAMLRWWGEHCMPDGRINPEEKVIVAELAEGLLSSLDTKSSLVVRCRYVMNFTAEETAAVLGIARSAVYVREKRALERMA